ncbi:hypothetical protein GGX14DRAFT_427151 [Mycena pura]|uniref:PHD-type domain-containing protein n=1 Tax=Mycena pura TaxID=153505 RepID=A0AAD6YLT8_9AGAR|nr:hypothetical protein GGX14DRAFT_427151 [Mycena pura]
MSAHTQVADDVFSQPVPHPQSESQLPLPSTSESGISAFSSGRTYLPTPQSPEYMGQYLNLQAPESPLAQASSWSSALGRPSYATASQKPTHGHSPQQQTVTPESSPYTPRYDPSRYIINHAIPHFNPYSSHFTTPKASSSSLPSPNTAIRPPRITTPAPSAPNPANLSSPFIDKLTTADASHATHMPASTRPPTTQIPIHIDDIFSSSTTSSSANPPPFQTTIPQVTKDLFTSSIQISTPPVSPTNAPSVSVPIAAPTPVAGGEMERIRQAMLQNQFAQFQDAEARRPDYLKRAKRPVSEADPVISAEDGSSRRPGVGIMDSPHKGRRIALFQETSDESFEESLMAGGYGRYRTADWIRQPQPMAQTPGPPGPSTVAQRADVPEPPQPPTEKELRRRRRLNAFRSNETTNTTSDPHTSKLFPVTLQGIGRVLVDALSEERGLVRSAEDASSKNGKRSTATGGKKAKKKLQEPSAREKRAMLLAAAMEDVAEKPNWPDTEFPWRLRLEKRAEITKEEEQQRMQRIEKFLDRDTDEEDGSDEEKNDGDDEELLSPTEWSKIYKQAQKPTPTRRGRGKMVSLAAYPNIERPVQRSMFFPTDPGDARAALLAKRTVRAISFRMGRREREQVAEDDDEVVCICNGKYDADDGDVVQCDQCQVWYHLHCIGVRSVEELGPEEEAWYCEACVVVDRSESSDSEGEAPRVREPMFVPTDSEPPRASRSQDAPLFQPTALQDSPMPWSVLKTPPRRSVSARMTEFGSGFSSVSDSRHEPVTPQGPSTPNYLRQRSSVHILGNDTPGIFDADDAPFDPTSTPSRGIKFGATFTTPKNSIWTTRANGLFETPSRRRDSSGRLFGAPGTLDESVGGGGVFSSPFGRVPPYDDSPIRRDTAPAGDAQRARRLLESPIAPSVGGRHLAQPMMLEDSPVMWSMKGKDRAHDEGLDASQFQQLT